jgi:TolB-like protein
LTDDKALGLKSWLTGPRKSGAKAKEGPESLVTFDVHRVAVLPFVNMSPDPQDEYFADGMTEEVISTLSKVPNIEVISRTSVMQYKKNPKPIKDVSKELEVGTVLEGGVRKAGNKLRITIQLIDARKDRHLWAESYDRELQDIFAIQSEVAAKVAEALTVKPVQEKETGLRKKPTGSTEAYTLYLKGRYHWNKRGLEDVRTALDCFEQAVKEDPAFALGYVGLADCYSLLSANWAIDPKAYHEKSKTLVARALELDPALAEAHASLGLAFTDDFRLKEAEEELRKALTLNPNYAPAHLWYYLLLTFELRLDEALAQIEKAVELDPLSANMNLNHGTYYRIKGDYQAALDLFKRSINLDPNYAFAHFWAGYIYGKMKMFTDARREFNADVELLRAAYPLIQKTDDAWVAFFEDDKQRVRKLLPEILANLQKASADISDIACFCFYLGENDQAFDRLELAYSNKEHPLLALQYMEIPESARKDARYLSLLKRLGLN